MSRYEVAKFRGNLSCHKLWLMRCLKNPKFRSIFCSSYFRSGSSGLFFDNNEVTVSYIVLMLGLDFTYQGRTMSVKNTRIWLPEEYKNIQPIHQARHSKTQFVMTTK